MSFSIMVFLGCMVSSGIVGSYGSFRASPVAQLAESACNAGDPGSIPELGRSAGKGMGCPLQYSWASLVAQLVKNIPAMQEHWVQFLGREDLLEKGKAPHSSILGLPWWLSC